MVGLVLWPPNQYSGRYIGCCSPEMLALLQLAMLDIGQIQVGMLPCVSAKLTVPPLTGVPLAPPDAPDEEEELLPLVQAARVSRRASRAVTTPRRRVGRVTFMRRLLLRGLVPSNRVSTQEGRMSSRRMHQFEQ